METLQSRMAQIKHKILVLSGHVNLLRGGFGANLGASSGKGGVGKSTVATQMALTLAAQGKKVNR